MSSEWISNTVMALVIVFVFFGIRFTLLKSFKDRELPDSNDEPLQPESDFVVSIEGDEVKCTRPDGNVESFRWSKLKKVEILTTSDGPIAPDMFWVFQDSEGGGAVIPSGATGEPDLKDKAFALSGFDHERFIGSQTSTDDATIPVWTRPEENEA